MFVIVVYDVGEKRVNKVRKKLKMSLTWTQNSVFEGEITESKLNRLVHDVKMYMEIGDSLYVYEVKNPNNINKKVYGTERNADTLFI